MRKELVSYNQYSTSQDIRVRVSSWLWFLPPHANFSRQPSPIGFGPSIDLLIDACINP